MAEAEWRRPSGGGRLAEAEWRRPTTIPIHCRREWVPPCGTMGIVLEPRKSRSVTGIPIGRKPHEASR